MKPKSGLFVLLFLSLQRPAQIEAICIPDPVKVKHVRGQVYFASGENRRFLKDAVVEIIDRANDKKLIATATSDANGNFNFAGIKPGRYLLRGRHPAALALETELTVDRGMFSRKEEAPRIQIVLGAEMITPCGGGYFKVIAQTQPISLR